MGFEKAKFVVIKANFSDLEDLEKQLNEKLSGGSVISALSYCETIIVVGKTSPVQSKQVKPEPEKEIELEKEV